MHVMQRSKVQLSEKHDRLVWAEQSPDNQVTKLGLAQHTWISLHDIASCI